LTFSNFLRGIFVTAPNHQLKLLITLFVIGVTMLLLQTIFYNFKKAEMLYSVDFQDIFL
jgi:hypothetical protein